MKVRVTQDSSVSLWLMMNFRPTAAVVLSRPEPLQLLCTATTAWEIACGEEQPFHLQFPRSASRT